MKSMPCKVLLVASCSDLSSGATWSLIGLANNLNELGLTVEVLLPYKGDCEPVLREKGIKIHHIKYYSYPSWVKNITKIYSFIPSCIKSLVNFIAHIRVFLLIICQKYDVIHINALTSCLGAHEALLLKKKLVWHVREFMEEDICSTFSRKEAAYSLISKASHIISISESVLKKHYQYLKKNKNISVIYNGVSTEFAQPHKCLLEKNKCTILVVGRIMPKKNQFLACQAICNLIKNGVTGVHLKVIGKVEDNKYYKNICQYIKDNKLNTYIHVVPPSKKIEKEYQSADIVLSCADNEAFGRTTVEAMLSGCLVIGSNSAGTGELIQDNVTGLLFQKNSISDLAECINKAIANPEKSNLIACRAQREAKTKFTSMKNAESIAFVYRRICVE